MIGVWCLIYQQTLLEGVTRSAVEGPALAIR